MRRLALRSVCALVALVAVDARALELQGDLVQGGLVRGQVEPGTKVNFLGREVRVSADGRFAIGFGRDFEAAARLTLRHPDGREEVRELAIGQRTYDVQRIDGLPEKMVTPDAAALRRIRREAALIQAARDRDTDARWFAGPFRWPAVGAITGVFGSQRILNGEPRQPHYGVDIAAPAGAPVMAPAAGRVALAEPDLYFTGGTVLLDHGHGVSSVFSHLSKLAVQPGETVAQGQVVGYVGATGRVTGAHLDWRVNWFEQRLDPALIAGPMPAPAVK
jgi:murein DD-endopeptidase MepM/ murein hydrolase activator NlpD